MTPTVLTPEVVAAVLAESRSRPEHLRFASTEWEVRETYASVQRHLIPTQTEMNQAFYVDVCRAEDRIREISELGRKLLDTLPEHWHDDAVVDFRDAIKAA